MRSRRSHRQATNYGGMLMRGVSGHAQGGDRQVSISAGIEGLRYVFRTPLIRSTMLLDFFATFFASATALLPNSWLCAITR